MGRYYRLSKKMSETEESEVMREIQDLPDVHHAELNEDKTLLRVDTEKELYPDVMYKVVNICSRAGHGLEVSFERFAEE